MLKGQNIAAQVYLKLLSNFINALNNYQWRLKVKQKKTKEQKTQFVKVQKQEEKSQERQQQQKAIDNQQKIEKKPNINLSVSKQLKISQHKFFPALSLETISQLKKISKSNKVIQSTQTDPKQFIKEPSQADNSEQTQQIKKDIPSTAQLNSLQFTTENEPIKRSNKGRKAQYPKMEAMLVQWIQLKIKQNILEYKPQQYELSRSKIESKALQLHKQCYPQDKKVFLGSRGWYTRFCKRNPQTTAKIVSHKKSLCKTNKSLKARSVQVSKK